MPDLLVTCPWCRKRVKVIEKTGKIEKHETPEKAICFGSRKQFLT